MLTYEEVMMIVKLLDSIHVLIIILNPIHSLLFSAFCLKCCLFIYFLWNLPTFKCLYKRLHEYMFLFTSRYPDVSFDVLYVQIFLEQNYYTHYYIGTVVYLSMM